MHKNISTQKWHLNASLPFNFIIFSHAFWLFLFIQLAQKEKGAENEREGMHQCSLSKSCNTTAIMQNCGNQFSLKYVSISLRKLCVCNNYGRACS